MAYFGRATAIHPTRLCTRPKVSYLHISEFMWRVMSRLYRHQEQRRNTYRRYTSDTVNIGPFSAVTGYRPTGFRSKIVEPYP